MDEFKEENLVSDESSKNDGLGKIAAIDKVIVTTPRSSKEEMLGKAPIGKLLLRLAVPAIVAQIINMLYNVVDRIYIARLGNDAALSGLTVCFPILMIISAFAALLGQGGAPLASIKLGQNKSEDAEKIMGNAFVSLLIVSVVLTVGLEFAKRPILNLFGATESSLSYADSYLFIYLLGTIFVQMSLGMNFFITAQGFSKISMLTIIIGAVINIILDPIFIFGFKMGVAGAAIATIIAQGVSAVWVLAFLFGKKSMLKLKFKNFKLDFKIILPILALGVSPFIMQMTESLVQLTFNAGFKMYAGSIAQATANIASMGVMFTVLQMLTLPVMGLGQGAQPIISYNYGAKNISRVKRTFKLLFIWSIIFSTSLFMAVMIFPKIFAFPISPSPEILDSAARGLRIFMAGSAFLGMQFSCQSTLIALGQAKVSLFLALFRKIILLVPLAIIIPMLMANKTVGLLLAEPIADVIAAITTMTMYLIISRKLFKKLDSAPHLLNDKVLPL